MPSKLLNSALKRSAMLSDFADDMELDPFELEFAMRYTLEFSLREPRIATEDDLITG